MRVSLSDFWGSPHLFVLMWPDVLSQKSACQLTSQVKKPIGTLHADFAWCSEMCVDVSIRGAFWFSEGTTHL